MDTILRDMRFALRTLRQLTSGSVRSAGVAFVASDLPAWRAMRIDPAVAPRQE